MGDYIFFFGTFILLLGFIYFVCLLKRDDNLEKYYKNEENESEYINSIKESIEKDYKPTAIKLTDYEEEQEKSAIISYDELIKNKDKFNVSYDESYENDNKEISVKKISLESTNTKEVTKSDLEVKLMKYDKEEEFLIALKQLQRNLTN
jgi:hypothetical protein